VPLDGDIMIFEIVEVQTYSGTTADERPVSFFFNNKKIMIEDIIDRWYESGEKAGGPVYHYFKIHAPENQIFILRHNVNRDIWSVLLF